MPLVGRSTTSSARTLILAERLQSRAKSRVPLISGLAVLGVIVIALVGYFALRPSVSSINGKWTNPSANGRDAIAELDISGSGNQLAIHTYFLLLPLGLIAKPFGAPGLLFVLAASVGAAYFWATRILRLLDLEFLTKGTNLVLIGNPGVGKTFLAKIVAWRACQTNQRVLFTSAMDMLNHLLASQVDHSLVRKLKAYTEPNLLVCDELGYLALDQQTSNLFYQVISTRHSQKRSTIITTNTPFSDWGNILFNTTIATAIADRLVENSEIFLLGGDSLRKPKNPNPPAESQ